MCLDICPPSKATLKHHKKAVDVTSQWAKRCFNHMDNQDMKYGYKQILVPIIQGGTNEKLRLQSAESLMELNADIYAYGGLAVGEPIEEMLKTVNYLDGIVFNNKPRYLMGVGTPTDIIQCIASGIDMFDCVLPTRSGRTGLAYTWEGKLNLRNSKYKKDDSPIDNNMNFRDLKSYSKSYINHLINTNEILASMILTINNISFYQELMKKIRETIKNNVFNEFYDKYIDVI